MKVTINKSANNCNVTTTIEGDSLDEIERLARIFMPTAMSGQTHIGGSGYPRGGIVIGDASGPAVGSAGTIS